MRISSIRVKKFRRFDELEITNIPETVKLVVITGPNGSGKSALFDALLTRYRVMSRMGWSGDQRYYNKAKDQDPNAWDRIEITTHSGEDLALGQLYIRSAYRNDPDFTIRELNQQNAIVESLRLQRMIDQDATVSSNYQRLASQAVEALFGAESPATTFGDYRERVIGDVRDPLQRLFPDLWFVGVGKPLEHGTFEFTKGTSLRFDYKNLSGGEKAAFDLIIDVAVKRQAYADAIYCIDEPELHLNTKVQGALLGELVDLLPDTSQLWIASHSIGMMRKARELHDADPKSVAFLDFGNRDFDTATVIEPRKPTQAFWKDILHVALDDLAALVAPSEVVICEGNPAGPVPGKNAEHDARIYTQVFAEEFPDVAFISGGSSREVAGDFFGLAAALPKVANGIKVKKLIDRDDHSSTDVADFKQNGITVLKRRHLESYLWDDEVLIALCNSLNMASVQDKVLKAKNEAIKESASRGNMRDDMKKAVGSMHSKIKRILQATQMGNDAASFARDTLSFQIKPGMAVYDALKRDIFES